MPRDSTVVKRPTPKRRNLAEMVPGGNEASKVMSDISAGFSELKRQSGTAVSKIKEGYQRIKRAIRP